MTRTVKNVINVSLIGLFTFLMVILYKSISNTIITDYLANQKTYSFGLLFSEHFGIVFLFTLVIFFMLATYMYIIVTTFNLKSFFDIFSEGKGTTFILLTLLCTVVVGGICIYCFNNIEYESINISTKSNDSGAYVIKNSTTLSQTYESNKDNECAILVKSGSNISITGATINKNGNGSNEYNSGVLTLSGITNVDKSKINTFGTYSNGLYSTANTRINVNDSDIVTKGDNSSCIYSKDNGVIVNDNVRFTTSGNNSPAILTDTNGSISLSNSTVTTTGSTSPLLYSKNKIIVDNLTGDSSNSSMMVLNGGSISLSNSKLKQSHVGPGVEIAYSNESTSSLIVIDSTLELTGETTNTPMFNVLSSTAEISMKNSTLTYNNLKLINLAESNVTFTTVETDINGDIVLDSNSTIDLNLHKTNFVGSINSNKNGKAVRLLLNNYSTFKLTADSYVTELKNSNTKNSNIDLNGFMLYVNGEPITEVDESQTTTNVKKVEEKM